MALNASLTQSILYIYFYLRYWLIIFGLMLFRFPETFGFVGLKVILFTKKEKKKEFKGQSGFFKVKVCQSLLGCYNNIFHNNISQLMIWLLWFNTTFLLINYYTTCCDNTYQKTFERQTKKSHRKFNFLYNSNYITDKLNFTSISFFLFFLVNQANSIN